jgi:hypothetical protein
MSGWNLLVVLLSGVPSLLYICFCVWLAFGGLLVTVVVSTIFIYESSVFHHKDNRLETKTMVMVHETHFNYILFFLSFLLLEKK